MAEVRETKNRPGGPFTTRDYLTHGLYFTLYGLFKYLPSPIGDPFRYWATRPFMRRLGKVRIYEGVTIWYPYLIPEGNEIS